MMSLKEMREKCQGPRRAKDTFYGRYVMRRLSIYITALLAPASVHPTLVNFVSIIVGLIGAWRLAGGDWFLGILLVNGWYLLDHVDGELARYRGLRYATGLFMDTMANPIIFPATYFGLGAGLWRQSGDIIWFYAGILAAYGALMMIVVPFCESMVILTRYQQGRLNVSVEKKMPALTPVERSVSRKVFSWMHECVTFPVFLPVVTALIVILTWVDAALLMALLKGTVSVYACAVNLVWISIVAHSVLTQKIDRHYPGNS